MPELVTLLDGLRFPEGPAFDSSGRLWCVELRGGGLVEVEEARARRVAGAFEPNGLAFDGADRAWVCDAGANAVVRYDPRADEWTTVVDQLNGKPLDRPNDLAFDGAGNLVFTCPGSLGESPDGYVCCVRADGSVVRIAEGLYFPNGLAYVDGGRCLVIAETNRRRLWIGGWDAGRGRWTDARPWGSLNDGGPDGMAVAADGRLFVAVFGAGQVQVVDPDGTLSTAYDLPGSNPTNVAFDPSGELGLVVTEAETGQLLSMPGVGPGVPLATGPAPAFPRP